jgi:hypothetical protein
MCAGGRHALIGISDNRTLNDHCVRHAGRQHAEDWRMNNAKELWPGSTLRTLWRAWNPDTLQTQSEAASTFFRFFRSKHVADLRFIAVASLYLLLVAVLLFASLGAWAFVPTAFTVWGAVLAWAYLAASARLGIVDLFACEISTICRVGAIVDIANRYVNQYPQAEHHPDRATADQQSAPIYVVSQENYFPVFDTNSRDLHILEAKVVIDITAFYTYMKATRDIQRKLAALMASGQSEVQIEEARRAALANMITMVFLGYESARKAIQNLIEYEPTRIDMVIVILITELKCYSFLKNHPEISKGWYDRVRDREFEYNDIYKDIESSLTTRPGKDWQRARLAFPVLRERYHEAVGNVQA